MLEAGVPHDVCPKGSRWKISPVGVAICTKSRSFFKKRGLHKELGSSLGCHLWQHPAMLYIVMLPVVLWLATIVHTCLSCEAGLSYTTVGVEAWQ